MTCGSIYKIKFPNGKHYIGLTTTSLEQRKIQHKQTAKRGDTKCLYNALRKYEMVDTLELIQIDTADTLEELCEKEITHIKEYNSYYMDEKGYNMTYGGDGVNGYVYTEKDNQENSKRRKKYFENNPEAGKEMSKRKKKYYE
ncbi:MAG: GIY-YIG nuclease family protein, partial [Chryseobacterium sp.]